MLDRISSFQSSYQSGGFSKAVIYTDNQCSQSKRPRGKRAGIKVVEKESKFSNVIETLVTVRQLRSKLSSRHRTLTEITLNNTPYKNSDLALHCKLAVWNVRSLGNKSSVIADLVLSKNLDILILTETWLNGDNTDDLKINDLLNTLCDHEFISAPRQGKGGGIGILLRKGFTLQREQVENFSTFEHLNLLVTAGSVSIRLIAVYRPPPSKKNKFTIKAFLDEFSTLTESLVITTGKVVIAGDFNFHVNDITNTAASSFRQLLEASGLKQHVQEVTHNRGHTLDLIITKLSDSLVSNIKTLPMSSSDHSVVACQLKCPRPKPTRITVSHRKLKSIDPVALRNDIASSCLITLPSTDVESLTNQYNTVLRNILNNHASATTREITVRPHAPWYNDILRGEKRKRRKFEKKWRQTRLEVDRQIYLEQCRHYHRLLEKEKKSHHMITLQHCDQHELFVEVDKMINGQKKVILPSTVPLELLPELFGTYFHNKIIALRENLNQVMNMSVDIQESCSSNLAKFRVLSAEKVTSLVKKSKTKSCKLDPIPTIILKEKCLDTLTVPITSIINKSLSCGVVPLQLKSALITPVIKKTTLNHDDLASYRPVSNLPFLSKLLERAVAEQVHNYLQDNQLYAPLQSAYRKYHSTETALLKVHNDILMALDSGQQVILVLLDLSSAFDTLDHNILLTRLEHKFGITDLALKWFSDYLNCRNQSVRINNLVSSPKSVSFGVPQGSVLGPLLFTLYISPLEDVIKAHNITSMFYADDSKLYLTLDPCTEDSTTTTRIENCIKDIKAWTTNNKLVFNDSKTEVMRIVSRFNRSPQPFPGIKIGNDVVPPVGKARDLGVILDDRLSLESHVNKLCKSASFAIYRIGRIRKYLDKFTCERLVHAFVTSILDQCNSLLYGLPKYLLDRVQRVQNTAARLVCCTKRSEHITPILQQLHWLPLAKRVKFKILLLTYKCLHGMSPTYLSTLINQKVPTRALRSSSSGITLVLPKSNTRSFGDRAFSVVAPTLWNTLPTEIKEAESLTSFKSKLKTHLFSND